MRINSNSMAINAYRNLSTNNTSLGKSLEKLSSGFRINRAADDAAGLVISQNLRAQVSGLRQATRNAQDGISVVQTAEGALNEVHTMLNRMRDLSVQSANSGANDTAARTAAQSEITELTAEIDRIAESTQFGGKKLLDGSYGVGTTSATDVLTAPAATTSSDTVTLTIAGGTAITASVTDGLTTADALGADIATKLQAAIDASSDPNKANTTVAYDAATDTLSVDIDGLSSGESFTLTGTANTGGLSATGTAAASPGGQFQIGANSSDKLNVSIAAVSSSVLGIGSLDVTTDAGASAAIDAFDSAIATVSTQRGSLGAVQNRFESMINNLQVTTENLVASESRIRDTDMASEMTNFTKNQILSQAGTAMLAQANQVPQGVLSLLR